MHDAHTRLICHYIGLPSQFEPSPTVLRASLQPGVIDLGDTSYMSSALQALAACISLKGLDRLVEGKDECSEQMREFLDITQTLAQGGKIHKSPKQLRVSRLCYQSLGSKFTHCCSASPTSLRVKGAAGESYLSV